MEGKANGKRAAFSGMTLHHNTATMGMDDLRTHSQPNAGAAPRFLRGEKRIKNSAQVFLGNPLTRVSDGDCYAAPIVMMRTTKPGVVYLFQPRFNGQLTARRHCINSSGEKIQEHLLELVAICQDHWQIILQLAMDMNVAAFHPR